MTALHSAAVQCGTNFPLLGNYVIKQLYRVRGQYLPTTMSVFMLSQLETEGSRAGVCFIVVPQ